MKPQPDLKRIKEDLEKRNRELACLYSVAAENRLDDNPEERLKAVTEHIMKGLQLPDTASVSIWLDEIEYTVKPIEKESVLETISFDIVVEGVKRGTVEIYFQEKTGLSEEEMRFIKEISLKVSNVIERRELAAELEQYVGRLKELVYEKTRELERSKKRYEDYFKDAPTPMLISDFNGDIMKANRAFYRLLQYPEDGSVHLNFVRDGLYENPAIRPVLFDKLKKDGFVESLEVSLLDRNGLPIPVIASYIIIDVDGVPCVESVYKDIRVRKELERRLIEHNENLERNVRQRTLDLENQKDLLLKKNNELVALTEKLRLSKLRLQTLFKAIPDTVAVIDANHNIVMANRNSIGNKGKCYKKIFNQTKVCEDCHISKVFNEKSSVKLERMIDNEYYLINAYPIYDSNNQVIGALEFSRVITKEKNMEQQLLQADKLASLGQLVSGIAHEINNPNTFIKGNLMIIQEALSDMLPIIDRAFESDPSLKIARLNYEIFRQSIPVLVDDMVQGANRIKGIVDGLRKFAKKDEGLLNEQVNVNNIIESCLRLVDNQIKRTSDVNVEFDPDLPEVIGNSQKLQQVVVNVLINASQAIDKPKGNIMVETYRENAEEIVVKISDNGKGMDEKTLKQIFDPFFTSKRHHGGTGLGLSIAYGIIKEHKGRIDVESKPGLGTTFYIHLPVSPKEA
ncbi:MAG TPA: ATP-binding protein [Syntrophorhabdaceae bacterium]|nr:PAS domain-containing protein [Syntrophorhabdaceae bacterium]MDI9559784.1 ATP-binding protein [Pseudomonadota bacterium]MBV6506543.1 Adaptive-response sensory-kinase SasA [Syntrophorhabdaceae bacterium]HNZ59149.1 ATP-binding protein [Syntrophorhabdaceae bacterium]HOB69448.1 ATP-binding protein [Syntrophorhabdaceae bacterium]